MKKIYTLILLLFVFSIATNAQELTVNGDFETWPGGTLGTWTSKSGTTILGEATIVHGGDSSMNVELTTGSQGNTDLRQSIDVVNGHTYQVSVWVYHLDTVSKVTIYADAWTNIFTNHSLTNVWQEITYQYTADADSDIEIGLRFYDVPDFSTAGSSFMYVDDYSVIDLSVSGTAPLVENVLTIPSVPTSSDNVDIQANITDDGTIITAYMLYNTDGSAVFNDSIEMTVGTAPTYQTTTQIPAQIGGTMVKYFIRAVDDNDEIGESPIYSYVISMGVATGDCENLFFSEYIEGSGNNKALEIYNPTDAQIDLSNYSIQRFNNGSTTASATLVLEGTIDAGGVYVLVNTNAVTAFTSVADSLTSFIGHNGNDAYILFNYVDTIDVFGLIGSSADFDIGTEVGGAANHTLLRKVDIHKGQKDWSLGNMEWNIYDIDVSEHLGSHTMDACISTSTEVIQEQVMVVYPNPVVNIINFDNLDGINTIELVDGLGNVVILVDVNSNKTSVNIACLKSGFYIARLKSNDKIKSIKFIKK